MSINNEYEMVQQFHKSFNLPFSETPKLMKLDRAEKRCKWIREEVDEYIEATEIGDIYEQADAMIDVIYFALGTLVELGIRPEPLFKIVQHANMSKLFEDGEPRFNEMGKVIKPSNWEDPHDKIVKAIDNMST